MITFMASGDRLVTVADGFADEEFVPETATRFVSADRDAYLTFTPNATGEVAELVWKEGKDERKIPRIGPLFHALTPVSDPDPARTRLIEAALKAMAEGGKSLAETPGISPGAKKGFAGGGAASTAHTTITFLRAENVAGRGIERHEGRVDQILHYKLVSGKTPRYVIVHLTPDGLVTDYDVVDK